MRWDSFSTRIRIVSVLVLLLGGGIIVRLFFLQVIHGSAFRSQADSRYQSQASDVLNRGTIYFSKKDGTLITAATVEDGYQLEIDANQVTDSATLYDALAPYIGSQITKADFVQKITPGANQYKVVATELNQTTADAINALKLPGATVETDQWRFYPGNTLAAQTLGFVGYDSAINQLNGQYGIERSYNSTLAETAQNLYVNFFAEVFANIKNTVSGANTDTGDVVTTIEPFVQTALEQALAGIDKQWSTDGSGGIIMNPKTGEIYAMGQTPTFDPNNYGAAGSNGVFLNQNVQSVFEFGSVIKPLVMAGALDEGVVTPQTTYDDKGFVKVNNVTIWNFDKHGRGPNTSMQDVLNQSLNTGMVFVEQKMGQAAFKKYLLSYDINQKTGIDLPGEISGLTSNLNTTSNVDYANAAFGQGIALTPVEAIRAFSSLGNGGVMPTPHVVKAINYQFTTKNITDPQTTTPSWNPAISQEITNMLVTVGQGVMKTYHLTPPTSAVAMKTGTAQIPDPATGGYYPNKYLHSMFAYFPAYNPQFIIFLYTKNPKDVDFSAQTLAAPIVNLTSFLLDYYNIAPDN